MIPAALDRGLLWVAAAHLAVGIVCALALVLDAPPILGVHPALKPMKFGFSIAVYLATMACVVPALSIDPRAQQGITWALALSMIIEMLGIGAQALRGTRSHFNTAGVLDVLVWRSMFLAVVATTVVMVIVAAIASVRPLLVSASEPMSALASMAWRAGLWMFLFAAVSGFAMGGRLRHSVGGEDGVAGLPLVDWSRRHGDLRVSHFFAMHALQTLPLIGAALEVLALGATARWSLLLLAVGGHVLLVMWTLLQAFAARPFF